MKKRKLNLLAILVIAGVMFASLTITEEAKASSDDFGKSEKRPCNRVHNVSGGSTSTSGGTSIGGGVDVDATNGTGGVNGSFDSNNSTTTVGGTRILLLLGSETICSGWGFNCTPSECVFMGNVDRNGEIHHIDSAGPMLEENKNTGGSGTTEEDFIEHLKRTGQI